MRVLTPALRGHRGGCAFNNFQQCLLNTLTGNVPRDRRVFTLASNLVNLVNVNDPHLGALGVKLSGLNQFEQNVFDVFTDVAGFGQRGGISDSKRNIEQTRKCLSQERLTRTCWTQQQNVGLCQLNSVVLVLVVLPGLHPLVVVVNSY